MVLYKLPQSGDNEEKRSKDSGPVHQPVQSVVESKDKGTSSVIFPVTVGSESGPVVQPYVRKLGNWIESYLEYTKESESPTSYHTWAGMMAISSVVKRKLAIDQGLYVLYPNLYVGLVGPPARTAKSTSMWLSRLITTKVPGIKYGSDATSREQLIRELAEAKLDGCCALSIHAGEFSSVVDTSGMLMIKTLTDLYDCNYVDAKEGWRYSTKTKGKDKLTNPYLTVFFGTTPTYLAEAVPDNIIGNGFTSRVIWVYEELERRINPIPPPLDPVLSEALTSDLRHISTLAGWFKWTPAGIAEYERFYHDLYKNPPTDYRIEGYHWRKKIHILKVGMILSVAKDDEMILDAKHILEAEKMLKDIEPMMARTFSAVGKYDMAPDIERIGSQVRRAGKMSIAEVFRENYHVGAEDQLRQVLSSLSTMGAITIERGKDGKEWAYATTTKLPWG